MLRSILVRRSPIHGNGVFAARNLPAGHTVIEYLGKLVTHDEADAQYDGSVDSGHTFLFTLNEQYIIDANHRGNDARWINHSCDPNCEAVITEDAKGRRAKDRIFIQTRRAVRKGEELTYDYGIKLECRQTARLKRIWACRCGKANCTGTMLQPKTRAGKKAAERADVPADAPGPKTSARKTSAGKGAKRPAVKKRRTRAQSARK